MTAHEVVIRPGRPFDVQLRGTHSGAPFAFTETSEITIPFADQQSAESAATEISVSVRPVHDAGGEDYRPVVAGEVLQPAAGLEGTVRASSTADGFTDVETQVIPEGVLQVTNHYAAVMVDDPLPKVIGWQCYRREATLNGEMILDPLRAQALADKAGIETPGPIKWDKPDG